MERFFKKPLKAIKVIRDIRFNPFKRQPPINSGGHTVTTVDTSYMAEYESIQGPESNPVPTVMPKGPDSEPVEVTNFRGVETLTTSQTNGVGEPEPDTLVDPGPPGSPPGGHRIAGSTPKPPRWNEPPRIDPHQLRDRSEDLTSHEEAGSGSDEPGE